MRRIPQGGKGVAPQRNRVKSLGTLGSDWALRLGLPREQARGRWRGGGGSMVGFRQLRPLSSSQGSRVTITVSLGPSWLRAFKSSSSPGPSPPDK